MLDLQKHKEYLWKYLLTYGRAKRKRGDYEKLVFPFHDIVMEEGKSIEDYRSEELKQQLDACASIVGAVVCVLLYRHYGAVISMVGASAVVCLIRYLAAHYRWNLPKLKRED